LAEKLLGTDPLTLSAAGAGAAGGSAGGSAGTGSPGMAS